MEQLSTGFALGRAGADERSECERGTPELRESGATGSGIFVSPLFERVVRTVRGIADDISRSSFRRPAFRKLADCPPLVADHTRAWRSRRTMRHTRCNAELLRLAAIIPATRPRSKISLGQDIRPHKMLASIISRAVFRLRLSLLCLSGRMLTSLHRIP